MRETQLNKNGWHVLHYLSISQKTILTTMCSRARVAKKPQR